MDLVEKIHFNDVPLAYIIRGQLMPDKTTFLTPSDFNQQVGFVVYPAGGVIPRHVHRPLERHLVGTSEVLVVPQGRCEIDIYNDDRQLVATRESECLLSYDCRLMKTHVSRTLAGSTRITCGTATRRRTMLPTGSLKRCCWCRARLIGSS